MLSVPSEPVDHALAVVGDIEGPIRSKEEVDRSAVHLSVRQPTGYEVLGSRVFPCLVELHKDNLVSCGHAPVP